MNVPKHRQLERNQLRRFNGSFGTVDSIRGLPVVNTKPVKNANGAHIYNIEES